MRDPYKDALLVQSACNLSGVVHSLAEHLDAIREEVRAQGGGTNEVNQHPAVRLFVTQLAWLAWGGDVPQDLAHFQEALRLCQERANAAPVVPGRTEGPIAVGA